MDEQAIAHAALESFTRETGLPGTLLAWKTAEHDCSISLAGHDLNGDIKRWASHNVALLLQRFSPGDDKLLLADYINANVAQKLQAAGIQFIDTAGNAFINLPTLKIRIKGNRQAAASIDVVTKAERIEQADRAFQSKGLVVIYHLLSDEELLTHSMRDIAERTGVAHGTVNIVLKTLESGRYLSRNRHDQSTIVDRKGLMERWVQGYAEKLAPKLLIGSFLDEATQWWGSKEVDAFNAVWGGEIAGRDYTQYLQPQIATLYLSNDMMPNIMQRYRLRKAPAGTMPNIKLMQRFWQHDTRTMASPLLTYAELIASGDPRNLETARLIHDRYLADA